MTLTAVSSVFLNEFMKDSSLHDIAEASSHPITVAFSKSQPVLGRRAITLHAFIKGFSQLEMHLVGEDAHPLIHGVLATGLVLLILPYTSSPTEKKLWSYTLTVLQQLAIKPSQNPWQNLKNSKYPHLFSALVSLPLVVMVFGSFWLHVMLWEASLPVIPAIISHSIISYFYIIMVGVASRASPYEVFGSHTLCSIASAVVSMTFAATSAFEHVAKHSKTIGMFQANAEHLQTFHATSFLMDIFHALVTDTFHLRQVVVQLVMTLGHKVYTKLPHVLSNQRSRSNQEICLTHILEVLQHTQENTTHLSALRFLTTITLMDNFDPAIVVECLRVLTSCVKVIDGTVMVVHGMEELAKECAICLLCTFSHLSVIDPMSGVLGDICQHYNTVFPPGVNFKGSLFYHTLGVIHELLNSGQKYQQHARIVWQDYNPPRNEHVVVAHSLTKLALFEHQRREGWEKKVPRWILRFVLHSLSLSPPPSTSIVVDCLSIIAIDLGCDVSIAKMILKRCVHTQ